MHKNKHDSSIRPSKRKSAMHWHHLSNPENPDQIHYEKEKLEKTTLPIEKFLEVQREREVNWQERKREEEKEERISHQEEQKRAYCQMLLAEASRIIDQEEKRGVPRYWSEHYVRGAYSDYSKCKWYK